MWNTSTAVTVTCTRVKTESVVVPASRYLNFLSSSADRLPHSSVSSYLSLQVFTRSRAAHYSHVSALERSGRSVNFRSRCKLSFIKYCVKNKNSNLSKNRKTKFVRWHFRPLLMELHMFFSPPSSSVLTSTSCPTGSNKSCVCFESESKDTDCCMTQAVILRDTNQINLYGTFIFVWITLIFSTEAELELKRNQCW